MKSKAKLSEVAAGKGAVARIVHLKIDSMGQKVLGKVLRLLQSSHSWSEEEAEVVTSNFKKS